LRKKEREKERGVEEERRNRRRCRVDNEVVTERANCQAPQSYLILLSDNKREKKRKEKRGKGKKEGKSKERKVLFVPSWSSLIKSSFLDLPSYSPLLFCEGKRKRKRKGGRKKKRGRGEGDEPLTPFVCSDCGEKRKKRRGRGGGKKVAAKATHEFK